MSDDRKAYHPAELPEHLRAAIRDAKMAPGNEHLDALVEPLPPVLSVKPSEDGRKLDHSWDRRMGLAR